MVNSPMFHELPPSIEVAKKALQQAEEALQGSSLGERWEHLWIHMEAFSSV